MTDFPSASYDRWRTDVDEQHSPGNRGCYGRDLNPRVHDGFRHAGNTCECGELLPVEADGSPVFFKCLTRGHRHCCEACSDECSRADREPDYDDWED